MPVRTANGRASDADQALEYSLPGDVILRHRNGNRIRPRDEHSLYFLAGEVALYTRRVKRKLNSPIRSSTEVNNNNNNSNQIKSQWPQENTQPRSSRVLCTRAVYANQTPANVDLGTESFRRRNRKAHVKTPTLSLIPSQAVARPTLQTPLLAGTHTPPAPSTARRRSLVATRTPKATRVSTRMQKLSEAQRWTVLIA